ncbi:MAG: CDP-diacylglycerol--glycerol-3-phosphate 3-phosphatidyltransferase [Bacilli bacterium]|nr:CDP-diacylglycerol--glycerol-3-phosphate 3-phosphatidyltransferase [Bacilli bacterium]
MKINIPTKITIARIVGVALLIVFLITCTIINAVDPLNAFVSLEIGGSGIRVVNLIACVVFILAAATDYLDGHLARKWNQVTDLGKFLDPIADKMLVNSMLVYLCFPIGGVRIPWFCVAFMIIRDLVIDTMRLLAAKKGLVVAANIFGKMKTVFQMVAIPFVLLGGWPFTYFDAGWGEFGRICIIMVYIATAMSIISGVIYVKDNFHVLKEETKDEPHA